MAAALMLTKVCVAPLAGSVDRNWISDSVFCRSVASLPSRGAWIEMTTGPNEEERMESLPSRGAWIEIVGDGHHAGLLPVAPLAGSVDRNGIIASLQGRPPASLPSRGAWIEIWRTRVGDGYIPVAPLAGSVDRNVLANSSMRGA